MEISAINVTRMGNIVKVKINNNDCMVFVNWYAWQAPAARLMSKAISAKLPTATMRLGQGKSVSLHGAK